MPRRHPGPSYFDEIPEWTERKHKLLARYMVPAAMKMRRLGDHLYLIDGYAGRGRYGTEIRGSTKIMLDAAAKVAERGALVTVFACEPDTDSHESLVDAFTEHIVSGLLQTFNSTHAAAVPRMQSVMGKNPALVFLDPHAAPDMTLASDVMPWATRTKTDILGIFMAPQACRTAAQMVKVGTHQTVHPSAYLGTRWAEGTNLQDAYRVFQSEIENIKPYGGIYRLRKQLKSQDAYGIFGLTNHIDGLWLLSDAIAKDFGALNDYDFNQRNASSLFFEDDREDAKSASLDCLVNMIAPYLEKNPSLKGSNLGTACLLDPTNRALTFGKYKEKDFTEAAKIALKMELKNA